MPLVVRRRTAARLALLSALLLGRMPSVKPFDSTPAEPERDSRAKRRREAKEEAKKKS